MQDRRNEVHFTFGNDTATIEGVVDGAWSVRVSCYRGSGTVRVTQPDAWLTRQYGLRWIAMQALRAFRYDQDCAALAALAKAKAQS